MSLHAEKIPLKDKPPKENGSGGIKDKSEILVGVFTCQSFVQ